uniref:Uncharacterized protein n=1 Tax=Desulfobacca acetoxidans TaxID=60893 RepID=A0A7C3Z4M4_9BACT
MDFKDSLRRDRVRGKRKEALPSSLFSHLGGLVRRYRLSEAFCGLIESMTAADIESLARRCQGEAKPHYEAPLFFLATPEEYQVIHRILAALANPYLAWARNPEELLLSAGLWRRRPALEPEILASRHFAALW